MKYTLRYILSRVAIGLLVGIGMFYFNSSNAAEYYAQYVSPRGHTTPPGGSGSALCESLRSHLQSQNNPGQTTTIEECTTLSPTGATGATRLRTRDGDCYTDYTGAQYCPPSNVETFTANYFVRCTTTGQWKPLGASNGQCNECTRAAGSPYSIILSGTPPASFCDETGGQLCEVTTEIGMTISGPSSSGTFYDAKYTGQTCPSETIPEPTGGPVTVEGQTFPPPDPNFTVIEWVSGGMSVDKDVEQWNKSNYGDGGLERKPDSPAQSPGDGSITVTFHRAGGSQVQLYTAAQLQALANRNVIRYQSGGTQGGGGPPNASPPVVGTQRGNADGSVTTVTAVSMGGSRTSVSTSTTGAGNGSSSTSTTTTGGGQPARTTTTTTGGDGGGGPTGNPDGGGGDGDSGDGEGDCTGDDCGECTGDDCGEGGGGEGAFTGKGGTAKTFGGSVTAFRDRVAAAPVVAGLTGIADGIPSGGECPTASFSALGKTFTFESHCPILDRYKGTIRAVFWLGWVLFAIVLFFRA